MKKIERIIRFMSLYQISPERIKPLLKVNRSYLEDVLKDIVKNYGSVESYFIEGCGIDKRILDRLQRRLLE
jgi:protein-tyrosine phosphatase